MNIYEERVAAVIRRGGGAEHFPRWKDPSCEHPLEALVRDGNSWICGECGRVSWL